MSFFPNRSLPFLLSLALGAGGFALGYLTRYEPAATQQTSAKVIPTPPALPQKHRSPRSALAAAINGTRAAFDFTRLDEIWNTVPHDEFYGTEEWAQAMTAHPAELYAWMEGRNRWPIHSEEDDLLDLLISRIFRALVAKNASTALQAALQSTNFKRRGLALKTLAESHEPSVVKEALGAYLAERKYRLHFGDAFDATGRSVEENIAFLQALIPSPGRDARMASFLNEANETDPEQIASHWNQLSTEARSGLVEAGFMARNAPGTKQFPGLLELAQQRLTTMNSHDWPSESYYFWNGIGGAWAREDFPAAWKWFQSNSNNLQQMGTEAKMLSQAFKTHPSQVLEIVRELPSLTREMLVLMEINRQCPPNLRPYLEGILNELPTQAQAMLVR